MSVVSVASVEVVNGSVVARGTADGVAFEASPFRWGTKMLMKVSAEGLDRGTRVAIGRRAKAAIKAAGLTLPEAILVRPRNAKVVEVVAEAEPAALAEEIEASAEAESTEDNPSLDDVLAALSALGTNFADESHAV